MSSLWKETHDRFSVIKAKTPVKNLPLSNFTFVLICTITIYLKIKKINNFLGTIWERPMGVFTSRSFKLKYNSKYSMVSVLNFL